MNKEYHIIGLMSGTSLDGLDIVKCKFSWKNFWEFDLEYFETMEYSNYWIKKLGNLHQRTEEEIENCNKEFGKYLGECVVRFLDKNQTKTDYISSHGHTIFHDPENNYTLQIGDGKIISNLTKITTINNFRQLDVELGGQGAPLVPIGDLELFSNYKYCLNLGGFANVSEKTSKNDIIAFDICAVNFVLNNLCSQIGKSYDKGGDISKNGEIDVELFKELNSLDFFKEVHPKSLGREWVEEFIYPIFQRNTNSIENKLRTFVEHIAFQIGEHLIDGEVLVTGGGTFNSFLIERIENYSNSNIIIPKKEIIDFKEAIIFAFLGVLKLEDKTNCLSSVTGAKRDCSGGDIYIK